MKSNFTLFFIGFLIFTVHHTYAQDMNANVVGGAYPLNGNLGPCLTDYQRDAVKAEIKTCIAQLKTQNKLAFDGAKKIISHPLFSWPIRKAAGINYDDIYTARFYVDQDMTYPNKILDFNCGTKTYDTSAGYNHAGVDLVTWPFAWKMVDLNGVEIIAAAAGQIIAKGGSQFDRSCTNNDNVWNAVYVQHPDGSVALYGHMKKNSLTTKIVGDMVAEGEFLGIVGSSGNSATPHLHFEVYASIDPDVLIDPFSGNCNSLNSDSWWQNQRPHTDPKINAVLTHGNIPVFPECPNPEITYESDDFNAADQIHFGVYLRDQLAGTSINLKIIRPDDSILYNWDYTLVDNYDSSWWMWYYSGVYNMNGQWKWQATYQLQTVTHSFNVTGVLGLDEEDFSTTSIYPNPFKNRVTVISKSMIQKATVTDVLGKTVSVISTSNEGIKEINLESLSKGMYFLTLEGNSNQHKIIKLIKE
jgi:murein DD-endopeptidase MepM/ murein hydrolase activator NlpD